MPDVVREYDRIAVAIRLKVSRRMYQEIYCYASDHKMSLAAIFRAGAQKLMEEDKNRRRFLEPIR